jgi:hypothetical protein
MEHFQLSLVPADALLMLAGCGQLSPTSNSANDPAARDAGTFEGRFVAPGADGLRHLAVNALSHGTLYDDRAPYDSKAWGIPFVVGASAVAAQP